MSIVYADQRPRFRLVWQVCFWLAIYLAFACIDSGYDHRYRRAFVNQALFMAPRMAFAYCVLYYLFPRFLYMKRYYAFCVLLVLFLIAGGVAYRAVQGFYVLKTFLPKLEFTPFALGRFLWACLDVSMPAMIAASIWLVQNRYESAKREQQLQHENLLAELRFLKAQVSPHFLFNTLNNIYGLSLAGSPSAPEAILRLSEVLRFVLHHAASCQISIEEELAVMDDYIALERLRYGERLDLKFLKEINTPGQQIAPLILLSLVENAFKHGASESLSNPFIHIALKVGEDGLHFTIANSKEPNVMPLKEGIGLSNIRRQLELTYRDQYSLDVDNGEMFYRLSLSINIHKHEQVALHDY